MITLVQSAIREALLAQLNLDSETLGAWRTQLGWALGLTAGCLVLRRIRRAPSDRLAAWAGTARDILRPVLYLALGSTLWTWAAVTIQRGRLAAGVGPDAAAVTAWLEHSPDVSGWTAVGTGRVVLVLRPPNSPPLRRSFSEPVWRAISKNLASQGVKVPAVSPAFRDWRRLRW